MSTPEDSAGASSTSPTPESDSTSAARRGIRFGNTENSLPLTVLNPSEVFEGNDGKRYLKVDISGAETYYPEDELIYEGQETPIRMRGELDSGWVIEEVRPESVSVRVSKSEANEPVALSAEIGMEKIMQWRREAGGNEASHESGGPAGSVGENVPADTSGAGSPTERFINRSHFGGWTADGKFELTVDPARLSDRLHIPEDILLAAAESGLSPEYLVQARDNSYLGARLRERGINWGAEATSAAPEAVSELFPVAARPPKKIEEMTPAERAAYSRQLDAYLASAPDLEHSVDPSFYQEARGLRRKLEVERVADLIEEHPYQVWWDLKRPGELPLKLHLIPLVGRRVGRLLLAIAVSRQTAMDRRKDGAGRHSDDGLLRIGLPRIRSNLRYISKHNEQVGVLRNKLGPHNNVQFKGPEKKSVRRDQAEIIIGTMQRGEALSANHRIHHENVYVHQPYKKSLERQIEAKKASVGQPTASPTADDEEKL